MIATPIGNLEDLSPRAAEALRDAELVACEDTRRTATLLRHAGSRAQMIALHRHNETRRSADLMRRIADGSSLVLVSDAGMPAISDPGARLIAAAHEAGVAVSVVPGPSAVGTAVAASGLAVDAFMFVGFLARTDEGRAETWKRADLAGAALVAFESPARLSTSLASLAAHDPDRRVAVCRELTKVHEEIAVDTATALAARFSGPSRGELTIVVDAPPQATGADDGELAAGLGLMLDAGLSARSAAAVATALGAASRNRAYRLATEIAAASEG